MKLNNLSLAEGLRYYFSTLLVMALGLIAFAQVTSGDTVTLKAHHPDGVPVHNLPQSTNNFVRVADGSTGLVLNVVNGQRWYELEFEGGTTGWVNQRYVTKTTVIVDDESDDEDPSSLTFEEAVWSSPSQCIEVLESDLTLPKDDENAIRLGTWNIRWFPKGCSPNGTCPDQSTDLSWLACSIAWMDVDVLALQEILDSDEAQFNMALMLEELEGLTDSEWGVDLHECGPPNSQKVGFIWNEDRVSLKDFTDVWEMNGASEIGSSPCSSNLRPGRYAKVESAMSDGVDFQVVSVHFDSGINDRDFNNRRSASEQLDDIRVGGDLLSELDEDVVILGDFNTMGKGDVSAAEEIDLFTAEITPDFRKTEMVPACTEYFNQEAGLLDYIIVSTFMKEADFLGRVSGYCAVEHCDSIPREIPMPEAYKRLSDHCPVLLDIRNSDID